MCLWRNRLSRRHYLAINIWEGARRRGALLPVDGEPEPITFVESNNEESIFRLTAAGSLQRRVDAGFEVFVVPVPPTGERWQVSAVAISHGGDATGESSFISPWMGR